MGVASKGGRAYPFIESAAGVTKVGMCIYAYTITDLQYSYEY